jgi:arsenite transporter
MWSLLIGLNKRLVLAILLLLVAGFSCGLFLSAATLAWFRLAILPLTVIMVYPMMVSLDIGHLLQGLSRPHLHLCALLINFICIPCLSYGLSMLFFPDQPGLALGLLLIGLLPTSAMTSSWTGFARGNLAAAANMSVIGLGLGALLVPLYVQMLLSTRVEVDLQVVARQILLVVFLPMLLGQLTRRVLLANYSLNVFKQELAPRFPATSSLGVLGIVFVAMALRAQALMHRPQLFLLLLVSLVGLYLANFLVSTVVARLFFRRADGIALVYGTVMRNLPLALAISMTAFGDVGQDAALIIAVAYIIQVQAAAWYVTQTDRLFGPFQAETVP